jgi:hypothetical protein
MTEGNILHFPGCGGHKDMPAKRLFIFYEMAEFWSAQLQPGQLPEARSSGHAGVH